MFEERKLHPIALIKELFVSIRKNIIPIAVGIFSIYRASVATGYFPIWVYLLIVAILVVLILMPACSKYFTFRYTLEQDGLRIRYGFIFHKNIFIPYERIQTIQQKQWFFFIPFHVTQVLIETAGGKKPEGDLSAVPISTLNELRSLRDGKKQEATVQVTNPFDAPKPKENDIPEQTVILKTKELLFMALTSSGVLAGLAILLAVLGQLKDVIPKQFVEEQFKHIEQMSVLIVILFVIALLVILWCISIVATLFKYFQFKLMKFNSELVIEKGLFQRNHTTISHAKIQAVVMIESPIRKWFNLVAVKVITAGSSGDKKHSGDLLLLPIMKKDQALQTLKAFLPEYNVEIDELMRVPKTSLRRFLFIYLLWGSLPFIILTWLYYPFGLISIIIPILSFLKAIASYRATGFLARNKLLLLQARPVISKKTYIVHKDRIQSLKVKQSVWMKRSKTSHLSIDLKSGSEDIRPFIRYLKDKDAYELYKWYRPHLF
ncbi:PH domain-containing protein [Listeria sp. PSOL-1]|uniref:PH domain-containing protein n=1 Tax=Listeria sp. PSOL-1 TaxID=1844999 RepID=UPI0013D02EF5|nr:PH domain-containing protein [Listeria sp. PSOL-1]